MRRPQVRNAASFLVPLVAVGLLFLTGCPGETPQTGKSGPGKSGPGKSGPGKSGPGKSGTASPTAQAKPEGEHDHDHHHHHAEKGPHGGALVAIGQDDAHLEIVLDADTGTLTAYVLDGHAEKAVAIKQKNLQLAITIEHGHDEQGHDGEGELVEGEKKDELPDSPIPLILAAVAPGEDGTSSEFSAQSDELKGAHEFEAALTSITIGETPFKGVIFKYPEGNEHAHQH